MNVYLHDTELDIVPGTQIVGSTYSSYVGDMIFWPEPADNSYGLRVPREMMPAQTVHIKAGDLFLFNPCVVHGGMIKKVKIRYLLTYLFVSHWTQNLSSPHLEISATSDEVKHELEGLRRHEAHHFKLSSFYSDAILQHPILSKCIYNDPSLLVGARDNTDFVHSSLGDQLISFFNSNKKNVMYD